MPWKPSDASRHTHKAKSAKGKRQWSQIANKLLSKGKPEGQAIREANGVAKRMYGKR